MKTSARRWLWACVVFLVLLSVIVAFLPRILSIGPLQRLITRRVNDHAPGQLELEALSLTWKGPLVVKGLQYQEEQGVLVTADSISVEVGLLAMLETIKDLGVVTIVAPSVHLSAVHADHAPSAQPGAMPPQGELPVGAPSEPAVAPATDVPALPTWDIVADVRISDGRCTIALDPAVAPLELKDLNAKILVAGLQQPVRIEADAREGRSEGPIEIKGSVAPGEDGSWNFPGANFDLEVACSGLPIGPVLGVVLTDPAVPRASGVMRCEGVFSWAGDDELIARGLLEVNMLELTGAILGDESPAWDRLECAFDLKREGALVRIGGFSLDSGDIRVDARGVLESAGAESYPTGNISGSVSIDMASLAGKIPRLLRLRDGTTIRSGLMQLTATVDSTIENQDFEMKLDLRDLKALVGEHEFVVAHPIDVRVSGGLRRGAPVFDELIVRSPLLQGRGSGDLERFTVALSNDLGIAMNEVKRFFDLEGVDAAGELVLQGEMMGLNQTRRNVTCTLTGNEIMLAGLTPERISGLSFSLSAATAFEVLEAGAGIVFTMPSIDLASPLLTAAFVGRRIDLPRGHWTPEVTGGQLNLTAKLDHLTDFMREIGEISESHGARGDLVLVCRTDVDANVIRVTIDELTVENFEVLIEDSKSLAQKVHLVGGVVVDRQEEVLNVSTMRLECASGDLVAESIEWRNGKLAQAECSIDMQLSTLVAALGSFVHMPEGSTLSGRLHGDVDLSAPEHLQRLTVDLAVDDFGLASLNKPPISDESIELRFVARRDLEKDEIKVRDVRLLSRMLTLAGEAHLSDWTSRRSLEARGLLGLDFETAAALVQHFSEVPLTGKGRKELPFEFETELSRTSWIERLRHTSGRAGVFAEEVELYGVQAGRLEIPVVISNELAHARLETAVGSGKISLHPHLNVKAEPPMLTVADGSQLLSDIELTGDVANELLAKVHPLFVGSVVTGGRIGLKMNRFAMPIDETAMRTFELEGVFSMENIELVPGGLLQQILGLARYEGELVTVADQLVSFERQQDRIVASPLIARVEGHSLQFCGSVGLDGSLDYHVELPLTRELVGDRAAKELAGKSVILDIGGTVSRPALGRDAFRKAVGRLIGSVAAEKIQQEGIRLLEDLLGQ